MVELTETAITMAVAVLGVIGTIIRYGLARGIRTFRGTRDAVDGGTVETSNS